MNKREISICQQTRALLYKNVIKKWRIKRESLWELLGSLLLILLLLLLSTIEAQVSEMPPVELGRIDKFDDSDFVVAYTPIFDTTQQIINKIRATSFMKGIKVFEAVNQEAMNVIIEQNRTEIVGIIFHDTFSYELKFLMGYRLPFFEENKDLTAHCYEYYQGTKCLLEKYWNNGFVAFQAAINAAIIEIATNHSVMDKMMALNGIKMKMLPFISKGIVINEFISFIYIISFTPLIYFASVNVSKERKKAKEWMKMMGLQDSAFWLSWGALYVGFIFIIATCLALTITCFELVIVTGYFVIFILFFFYGLSLVAFAFLLSVLIKRPVLTGSITIFLIALWGCFGFISLHRQLPESLEWILCLLSPFAFTHGMIQIMWLDYDLKGFTFHDPTGRSHVLIATIFMLIFDTILYLALTFYFDKILPREYGYWDSPLFFLKSRRQHRDCQRVIENETSPEYSSDFFEPIFPEFHGKEIIRIRNIRKEYKRNSEKVEALKGLQLDIYKGQITAILGHSGAGKSTLINILSGLIVPTEGSATIYNNKLSDKADLEEIRKIIGVCPQFNVQFDFLTVKENLRLFAEIKGIQPQKVEQEVQRVVTELEMKNIQNIIAENLSGGQKRKLTFAIAILGDPQVLLLDEPTAGLDPFSRHQVWNILKEGKSERGILLSTQFMDEADILADRKIFISNGQLKCAGSSLFLKRKWGIGYHLSLQKKENCDSKTITSLVKHHIPDAKLREESEEKLVYTLPLERTDKFPDLYRDIDSYNGQGIVHYGVSKTTLNEVFLKLEGKAATDEADFGNWVQVQAEVTRNSEDFVELDQALFSLPERRKVTLSPMALWRQQVWAIARLRFLKLKHDRKTFLTLLLLFGVALVPSFLEKGLSKILHQEISWGLSPKMYFLSPGQYPQSPLTSLLIINNTGSNIEDFIDSLKHQNIAVEIKDFVNKNGIDDPSYNGAIIVSGTKKDYEYSVACNTKRLNCFPVLVDIISNGLLKMFNSSKHIQTERSLFPLDSAEIMLIPIYSDVLWITLANSISPYIAMSSIYDYKIKAQSQLRISGLYPSAYWCGQALVDIPLYCLILSLTLILMYILNFSILINSFHYFGIIFGQILSGIGYAASTIFFTYIISFIFCKRKKNRSLWSICFFIVSIIVINIYENFSQRILCIIFIPFFTLIGIFELLSEVYYAEINPEYKRDEINKNLFFIILIPYLHCIIFVFVLRYLEKMKYGKKSIRMDPIFRIFPSSIDAGPNPEEPEGEDEDIQKERERTANALTVSNLDEKPVIIASCLRKEYEGKKKSCFAKKKKKLATRNISFCVKKGEVLGLLGHNGAGKSTAIRMITGDISPTAGKVVLKRSGTSMSQEGNDMLQFFGYCAQENSLWQNITVREHLELYAAVKGMAKEDAFITISRLADALTLQEYMKSPVKQLPPGIKRKLCFALSILGNPAIVLLDEPSTGMDPEGQQQIWQAIRATFKNKENGAILTTHYMTEAEAVCDRVAIMVSGQLRCIGSIQHLKSKFGKNYLLEIKVKEPEQIKPLHSEILKLFPRAARQERYSSFMAYKLPMEDVQPLSQAFSKLEAVKCTFNLEEYSLSQSTLEQIFLELSKDQEMGDFEEELDTNVKWKLLPQEEP